MNIVFYILSALSAAYFGLIVIYSGISTDFCGVWIAIALIFLVMGIFVQKERRERKQMPGRLPVFVYTTFVLWAVCSLVILSFIARAGNQEDTEGCDYCIVMGDRIYEDGISSTLKLRLDKACEYAEKNSGTVLVLSGGTDSGDAYPEALAMYNYLVKKEFPEDRLLIEAESDSTESSLRNSLESIAEDRKVRMIPPPVIIGVITSDYHMYRTLATAKRLSSEPVYPVVADSDPILFVHQCVRECAAVLRDRLFGSD